MNLEMPDRAAACKSADKVGDRIFIEGNSAAALGAVYGGATVCAWYPITPSSSLADAFTSHCKRLRVDPETKKAKYAIVQAEDELASIGIVIGAGLERRARLHRDLRPRHLADAGVHRAGLFRRNSGGDLRRAARRALDRHADAHPAMRHHQRAPTPRTATPSTCCCSPRTRPRRSRWRRRPSISPTGCRPDLRHARPRHRHEPPAVPAAEMGRRQAVRPRQGHDGGRCSKPARISAAISTSTATAFPTAPIRARIRPRARSSPAAPRATATRATPRKARPTQDNMQRLLRKFETAKDLVPRPLQANAGQADQIRRDLFRLDLAGDGRGDRHAGSARPPARPAARARLPVPFQRDELHRRARLRLRGRAEPRQPAALADRQRDAASIRCGWFRSCTTTARRSPRASSPAPSAIISISSK